MCQWRKSNTSRKERGQGMVEFALVIPILLLLMVGIFEFSYFFFVYSSVNTAAREAVRYGAGTGTGPNGVAYYMDCQGIRDTAERIGSFANIAANGTVSIYYDKGPDGENVGACGTTDEDGVDLGDRIVVEVDVTYFPILLDWMPDIPIHSQSARTIIKRMQVGG